MKPLLPRDRAPCAVPARFSLVSIASLATIPSFATRFGAWARESLVARGIGILLGLGVLALIGGSAVAGTGGARTPATAPSASVPPPAASAETKVDAGTIAITEPELLPRAPPEAPAIVSAGAATRATPDDPVDLNRARVADLRRLPGVGEKRAEAILALRARLPGGRFQQIEDLLKVKGVGRAMLRRLHPLVRL